MAQRITPFLWFDNNAEEAVNHYLAIFQAAFPKASFPKPLQDEESKIIHVSRQGGAAFLLSFQLMGQRFMALNAGPKYKFTEAISLFVDCDTQEQVDLLWEQMSEGGSKGRCGWLKDKFGLSWQIIPKALGELMGAKDPAKAQAVMQAMLQMDKIDIATLRRAYEQS